MRMMLRFTVPVERGNEVVKDGTIGRTFEKLMTELKPEAAYFFAVDGERAGMMVFDLADSSGIPLIAEPLFQNLDATVELIPVMNADELKSALSRL